MAAHRAGPRPWDPRACHGGPVSALLARAIEQVDDSNDWQIARLTIELTRPVPVGAVLELTTDVERGGPRVSIVGSRLLDDGTEVARVRALQIRLTVHLLRPPTGEWIALRAASFHGTDVRCAGTGMAESALYDTAGRLGRSVQSLFIDQHRSEPQGTVRLRVTSNTHEA